MANDLFDSLRTYINKVSVNEKSAAEIANSVNAWVRESGEAVKQKIEEEVESTVLRMGFVKRAEFEALAAEVAKCDLGETSIMKRDNGSSVNCSGITYGKIIPHLQQLFNTDKKT